MAVPISPHTCTRGSIKPRCMLAFAILPSPYFLKTECEVCKSVVRANFKSGKCALYHHQEPNSALNVHPLSRRLCVLSGVIGFETPRAIFWFTRTR